MSLEDIINKYAYHPTADGLERVKKSMRDDIEDYTLQYKDSGANVQSVSSNYSASGNEDVPQKSTSGEVALLLLSACLRKRNGGKECRRLCEGCFQLYKTESGNDR